MEDDSAEVDFNDDEYPIADEYPDMDDEPDTDDLGMDED